VTSEQPKCAEPGCPGPEDMTTLRERGCHAVMTYLARECGYADPVPVEPEDERAALQRQFVEASRAIAVIAERIERMSRPVEVRRA
jgi:hypothetical protein